MQSDDVVPQHALPLNFKLGVYRIEGVLGQGGFGITYLASDTTLQRKVVIKENFPREGARRDPESFDIVATDPEEELPDFERTKEKFLEEARVMAKFDHPGIVKVHECFEANRTVYFVMPYQDGLTLAQAIRTRTSVGENFPEKKAVDLLTKILEALQYLHGRGVFHRDIKPQNILITNSFDPVLIDFGGFASAGSSEAITVIESDGYTPYEQLKKETKIGAYTDLYALGATFCEAITGTRPPHSASRVQNDQWIPLADRSELCDRYSFWLLQSIDKALVVSESERLQSAQEWLVLLNQGKEAKGEPSRTDFSGEDTEPNNLIPTGDHHLTAEQDGSESISSIWSQDEISEDRVQATDTNSDAPVSGSSALKHIARTATSPLLEILRWLALIPGILLGAGIIQYLAKAFVFLSGNVSGDSTWMGLIFNTILVGLAYGAGAIFCAQFIAPRGKKITAVVTAITITLLSILALFGVILRNNVSDWQAVVQIISVNVSAIWSALAIWNDDL